MNYARILGVTNWLLILIGYQVHCFEKKSRKYRLSLWIIIHFTMLTLTYLIAFAHHFELSSILILMQDASPFLRRLIRLQVLMGFKIYLFSIYEMSTITRAANQLADFIPKSFAKRFTKEEAFAYFLNFSTLLIAFGICLYVAIEMKFELPPLDNILIFTGLFMPHFMLGGALKMYNVGIWLLREQMITLNEEFQSVLPKPNKMPSEAIENNQNIISIEFGDRTLKDLCDFSAPLEQLNRQLNQLSKTEKNFNSAIQRQLILLVLMNSSCLLAGTYSRVYYETTWNVIFMQRTKNIFQATNFGIFILICWDYFILGLTQSLYEKVKSNFSKNISVAVKERRKFTESTRFILTDMHDALRNDFDFKLPGSIKINLCTFLVLQIFVGLIIALIVIYHYLNDQIILLNERFDGQNDDDDK